MDVGLSDVRKSGSKLISFHHRAALHINGLAPFAFRILYYRRVNPINRVLYSALSLFSRVTTPIIPRSLIATLQAPSLGGSLNNVMAALATHQQHEDAPIASSTLDAKPSDDMSSSNVTDGEPDEKAVADADAEAGKQRQKPMGGPPGGPPPNGGTTAWLQVLGGFFLFFNTWVCLTSCFSISLTRLQCKIPCLPWW